MKAYFCKAISILSMVAIPVLSQAEEPESDWAATAEVGYIMTGGNTDTEQLNAKFAGQLSLAPWTHALNLEALTASEGDETNAERYLAVWKTDYAFSEHSYIFLDIKHDVDRFSGFDYQTTLASGYGRRLLNTDTMYFDAEIGPGYRISKEETGDTNRDAIIHVNTLYDWKISDTASFTHELTVDTNSDLTASRSVAALVSQVAASLAMKFTYTLRHQSRLPEDSDAKKLDRELGLTLVYSF